MTVNQGSIIFNTPIPFDRTHCQTPTAPHEGDQGSHEPRARSVKRGHLKYRLNDGAQDPDGNDSAKKSFPCFGRIDLWSDDMASNGLVPNKL